MKENGNDKGAGPSKTKARAYAMTIEEAREKPGVVSSRFLINNIPASVLFESGATFNFVSSTSSTLWDLLVQDITWALM
jgi:hypothetical protein